MEPFTRLAQRVGKDDQLAATARLVFAALDSFLDKRNGRCAPTLARLAGWVGRHPRNVRRALRQLEAAGYVAVDRSAGRRNGYRLLPTPGEIAPGTPGDFAPGTPGDFAPGTPGDFAPGLRDSDRIGLKEQEGKNAAPPPVDLFTPQYREWFTAALSYLLAEVLELAQLAEWFPALAADFFLAHSWHRSTDPETARQWARALAAIAATEAEAREAFRWALSSPEIDRTGRKVFSRPDHLARILFRIRARRHNARARIPEASPAAEPIDPGDWTDTATEAERLDVEATIRRRSPGTLPGGLRWRDQCRAELARRREG